jgi:hypothetical protein
MDKNIWLGRIGAGFALVATGVTAMNRVGILIAILGLLFVVWSTVAFVRKNSALWQPMVILGVSTLATGITIALFLGKDKTTDEAQSIRTVAVIQFYGDNRHPSLIHQENIAYASEIDHHVDEIDTATNTGRKTLAKSWTIFVLFKQRVKYGELLVNFDGGGRVEYQVDTQNDRCGIILINTDVPPGILEISARPL